MSSADTAKMASTRSSTNSDAAPRERILSSALDLFYRHGIHAVGVDAIAEAAATNKMTLYRHFDSKDLLVAECLRRLAAETDAAWEENAGAHAGETGGLGIQGPFPREVHRALPRGQALGTRAPRRRDLPPLRRRARQHAERRPRGPSQTASRNAAAPDRQSYQAASLRADTTGVSGRDGGCRLARKSPLSAHLTHC